VKLNKGKVKYVVKIKAQQAL